MILRADARAIPLRDESVQCVVTSPPFWGLRDYGIAEQLGLEAAPDCLGWATGIPCGVCYVCRMVEVFREVHRVLHPSGTLWLNLGDCYATGAGKVGDCPGGGAQGERWAGRDDHKGRGTPSRCGGRTRGPRPGAWHERENPRKNVGPIQQPNRMPIAGLKPKDLVGIPWRVAFALQADGWWLRSDVIWNKENPMPESVKDRPTKAHEYIFLLTKSERYFYNADAISEHIVYGDHPRNGFPGPPIQAPGQPAQSGITKRRRSGNKERVLGPGRTRPGSHLGASIPWEDRNGKRNRRSVWTINTQPYPGSHFATFPEEIPRLCILAGSRPGDVVLDPFGGSGTTAKVALNLGRKPAHIDLTYHELAKKRMTTTPAMAGLMG